MSKTTNKQQIELLVKTMQAHPDVARGFYKGSKEEFNRIWQNLESKLNAIGPPSKNASEWKKVWTDQKKYIRHKAASKASDGVHNLEHGFSATEKAIYDLIAIQEPVECIAKPFGLGFLSSTIKAPDIETGIEDSLLSADISVQETLNKPPTKKLKMTHSELPPQKGSAADVLVEELAIQKEMCKAMKDQEQNTRKIYRSIDRLYDIKKKHSEEIVRMRKEEIEELKRHNLTMERLRHKEIEEKIEQNRRILEIRNSLSLIMPPSGCFD